MYGRRSTPRPFISASVVAAGALPPLQKRPTFNSHHNGAAVRSCTWTTLSCSSLGVASRAALKLLYLHLAVQCLPSCPSPRCSPSYIIKPRLRCCSIMPANGVFQMLSDVPFNLGPQGTHYLAFSQPATGVARGSPTDQGWLIQAHLDGCCCRVYPIVHSI